MKFMPLFKPQRLVHETPFNITYIYIQHTQHNYMLHTLQHNKGQCKVCKSVYHRTIQINHQPDATIFQFIILTFIYSSTCFGRFTAHHHELNDCSGSLWFYLRIVVILVLFSWSGRPARPRTQHDYHHLRALTC